MKKFLIIIFIACSMQLKAQSANELFNASFKRFTEDSQFRHATIGLYVINTTSGETVTELNTEVGLAPASCQKVITAATAFELLGQTFSYKTNLAYSGKIVNGVLNGDIIITGNGDPTLGSWRYKRTTEASVIQAFQAAILQRGIQEITGHVYANENLWNDEATPGGWIWQDIGNYYGAGARAINWRENQYDLFLNSGNKIGDTVKISGAKPSFVAGLNFKSMATSAAKGSGDRSYLYLPLNDSFNYLRGTIPINETRFSVSGAMPHPALQLALTLEASLKKLPVETIAANYPRQFNLKSSVPFYTYSSPILDSMIFYFLRRSINLYGESLIKTLGYQFSKTGSTDSGVSVIKKFWKQRDIEPTAINIFDGSGLSPANRVTSESLVTVMQYARKQNWFPSFYNALPTISGFKMKSGSINGVISYTGYIKGKNNSQYTFAFIINNYNGNGNEVRKKMWKLLGEL